MNCVECKVKKANYYCGSCVCDSTTYCGEICQTKHWPIHKYKCSENNQELIGSVAEWQRAFGAGPSTIMARITRGEFRQFNEIRNFVAAAPRRINDPGVKQLLAFYSKQILIIIKRHFNYFLFHVFILNFQVVFANKVKISF
jgi:hypothetical protein